MRAVVVFVSNNFRLKMFQFLAFAHEARAVENHDERADDVQDRGGDRADVAERRRRQPDDDEADAERKILVDDGARAARKLHEERQPAQVVVHQRNRRAVDGHFAARRAHRDADVTRRERGRVVHAVADDRNFVAFQFHRADEFNLVLRQAIALRFLATDFIRDARGDDLTVAGNHREAADAGFFQFRQSFFRLGARLVLHPDPADALAVLRDENQTPAFGLVQVHGFLEARVNAVVLEPLRAANENFYAVDLRLHAAPGGFRKIFRLGQRNSSFARERRERLGGRMVAVFFGGRGEQQKFSGLRVANRREAADGELAGRECAGFVEDERIYFRGKFDVGDIFN